MSRTRIWWGLYWGILIWGNYHIDLSGSGLQLLILQEFDPIGLELLQLAWPQGFKVEGLEP